MTSAADDFMREHNGAHVKSQHFEIQPFLCMSTQNTTLRFALPSLKSMTSWDQ